MPANAKDQPLVISVADRAGCHIFASALRDSGYLTMLEGAGPFTMFAPLDQAFKKFGAVELDKLLRDERANLSAFLGHHFAKGKVATDRLIGKRIRAVMHAGGDAIIDGRDGLRVNRASLVTRDLQAGNGIVHCVDAVLRPRATFYPTFERRECGFGPYSEMFAIGHRGARVSSWDRITRDLPGRTHPIRDGMIGFDETACRRRFEM